MSHRERIDLSVVIPVFNEQKNVRPLVSALNESLGSLKLVYELIFVDDGSRDQTFQNLVSLNVPRVRVIRFRGNFGQTAAMDAGFKHARGGVIVSMDGDLQNDPGDIPRLLAKLNQGFDVVCGWRKHRRDSLFKHFVSRGANVLRKIILRDRIHDSGCSLRAYRLECFDGLDLFGETHRFIPALLEWQGFRVTELVVRHHPRRYGKTKYTVKRVLKGFLDMLVVKFWMQYSTRPVHIFGGLGVLFSLLGFLAGGYLTFIKFWRGAAIADRPLLLLAVLLIVLGIQFLVFGVLADILVKVYYHNNKNYNIAGVFDSSMSRSVFIKKAFKYSGGTG